MLTYSEAAEMMARSRNRRRKLGNNTYLVERKPGEGWAGARYGKGIHYAVRLYNTDVVTIHPNGAYTFSDGGWYTVTTKERMNGYGNRPLDKKGPYPFEDGMTVLADGRIA